MKLKELLIQLIKHPLFGVVFGAGLAVFLFYLSQSDMSPRYSVSNPKLLAEITDKTPRLKLLWDDKQINNIYSVDVLIWNAGKQFIDNSSISSTDPIILKYSKSIQVLYSNFSKTSRSNLALKASNDSAKNIISINIVGDEALEQGDGGMLSILFTGPPEASFIVEGRIKGHKEGFSRVEWSEVVMREMKSVSKWLMPITIVMQFLMGAAVIFLGIKRLSNSEDSFDRIMAFSRLGMGTFMIVVSAYFAYDTYKPLLAATSWAA